MEHTPTPWKMKQEGSQMILAKPPKSWKPTPEHPRYVVLQTDMYVCVPHEEARANAAHIVRCVNSHDALVEALEKAKEQLDNNMFMDAFLTIDEALKLAKGE